jgi:hypothetical protein
MAIDTEIANMTYLRGLLGLICCYSAEGAWVMARGTGLVKCVDV